MEEEGHADQLRVHSSQCCSFHSPAPIGLPWEPGQFPLLKGLLGASSPGLALATLHPPGGSAPA